MSLFKQFSDANSLNVFVYFRVVIYNVQRHFIYKTITLQSPNDSYLKLSINCSYVNFYKNKVETVRIKKKRIANQNFLICKKGLLYYRYGSAIEICVLLLYRYIRCFYSMVNVLRDNIQIVFKNVALTNVFLWKYSFYRNYFHFWQRPSHYPCNRLPLFKQLFESVHHNLSHCISQIA